MLNRSPLRFRQMCVPALLALIVAANGCDRQTSPDAAPSPAASNTESAPAPPRHEGTWSAVTATLAGEPFPAAVTNSITLTIKGDQYTVDVGGQPDKGTCTTDTAQTPHRMTITGTEGPNAGKTLFAIADFPSENQMRICYDMAGKGFPASFDSTAANGYFVVVYTRKP